MDDTNSREFAWGFHRISENVSIRLSIVSSATSSFSPLLSSSISISILASSAVTLRSDVTNGTPKA